MKRMLLLAALVCAGCAGGGGQNPFAGNFIGTWGSSSNYGTTDWTIAPDGTVTGTIHDAFVPRDGTVNGTMGENGQFTGTITYPGGTVNGAGPFTLSNNNADLDGVANFYGTPHTFDLARY